MGAVTTESIRDHILGLIPANPYIMHMRNAGALTDVNGFAVDPQATYPQVGEALKAAQEEFRKSGKLVGYRLKRERAGGEMFLGVSPLEVSSAIAHELFTEHKLGIDDRDTFTVEAFEITQKEIDAMPEFQGWQ